MKHFNFSSAGAWAAEVSLPNSGWLLGGQRAREVHDAAARKTLAFLEHTLKGSARHGDELDKPDGVLKASKARAAQQPDRE